jgi:hypothetical protein
MANKTSKKSAKVAKKAATRRADAKAANRARRRRSRSPARSQNRPSSQAATLRSRRVRATPPCRPTSRRCRAGNATSGAPRRAHRTYRSWCAQGREVELALLWPRGPRLVPRRPLLHEIRQGGFLPRRVAASCPPGKSKSKRKDTRYLDIHEDDQLDEAQLAARVKQASQLPGEPM